MKEDKMYLEPCPLCKSRDIQYNPEFKIHHSYYEGVSCMKCGMTLRRNKGVGVVEQWNFRTLSDPKHRELRSLEIRLVETYDNGLVIVEIEGVRGLHISREEAIDLLTKSNFYDLCVMKKNITLTRENFHKYFKPKTDA